VAGFSFGDEHINNLMFGALENRPRTHIYALQFDELPEENDLVKRACQRPNMIVIGPATGLIGGRRAAWEPVECPAFMGDIFHIEPRTSPRDCGANELKKEPKAGLMRIGDFASFSSFLQSMIAG